MRFAKRAITVSVLAHACLFWLLARHVVTPQPLDTPKALKTYLVIDPMTPPSPEQPEPPTVEDRAVSKERNTEINKQTDTPITPPAREESANKTESETAKASATVVSEPKLLKLSPSSVLERIRQQNAVDNALPRATNQSRNTPSRLTVPSEHKDLLTRDTRTVVSKNELWTEFKDGDSCYKVMNMDPNNPPPDGFPKTWTAPVKCKPDAINSAYNEAMNKWLPNKR
ncbi:hypothetical protein NI389_06190 [Pseudoalteromonas xiamenensis]|uniref:hypothetical protein n=1 Tax=Pseudoalteromonas xiamenensis TaxID=882626 RepID=UPI0027E55938|nr:hypothetical protein [Pseudoalteromonas xiamenensis]WMN60980.1 hypothetical protein NI389_06190 [Pseudoalteromonas xiamenensis]